MRLALTFFLITAAVFGLVKLIQYVTNTTGRSCGGLIGETGAAKCPAGFRCDYSRVNSGSGDAPGICTLGVL